MDSVIISGLIGGLVSVVLCTFIYKSVRKAKIEGELKFGTFLVVLAWCCFGFVLLAVWALFNDEDAWEKPSELYSIIMLFVGFGIAATYCFGEYFKVHGEFDSEKIDFYTPWTGRKIEYWNDLISVEYRTQANWYTLSFKSGKTVRLSSLLSGHEEVLKLVKARGYNF